MSILLTLLSGAFLAKDAIKEKRRPTVPKSYWRNKELMNEDKLNPNISPEQVQRNLENGKYYLSDEEYEHRQKTAQPNYSCREGEDFLSWSLRLSRQNKERLDKLYGRK